MSSYNTNYFFIHSLEDVLRRTVSVLGNYALECVQNLVNLPFCRRNLQESSNSRPDSCIDKQQQTTPVPPVAVVRFDEELLEKMIAEYLQAIDESTVLDVEAKNEAVQYCYRRLKKQIFLERQAVKTPTAPQKSKLCIIL